MEGISKSQVSRLCAEIDERVQVFLHRPIEGDWPYVWLDATYVKVRRNHQIVSVAVIVAVGVSFGGKERTAREFSALFRQAGLRLERIHPIAGSFFSILEGSQA
jgi:hypothetical protein